MNSLAKENKTNQIFHRMFTDPISKECAGGRGLPKREGGGKIKAISANICQEAARELLELFRNQVEMTAVSGSTHPTNALSPSSPARPPPQDWSCSLKAPEGCSQDTVTAGRKGVRQGFGINRSVAKRERDNFPVRFGHVVWEAGNKS